MFFKKQKQINQLTQENKNLISENTRLEEIADDYEALHSKLNTLEVDNQLLSGTNSELENKVAYYERLEKIKDINAQLKSNELRHKQEKAELCRQIDEYILKIRSLEDALAQKDLMLLEIKGNSDYKSQCEELKHKIAVLKEIIAKPKNTKLKHTRTEQFYVTAKYKGREVSREADISVVSYSVFKFDEDGTCMKETHCREYFLERFYWPGGGYVSFESEPCLIPDKKFYTFNGSDGNVYQISFSSDMKVKPWKVSVNHVSVIKRLLSKILKDSKDLHKRISDLISNPDFNSENFSSEFEKLKAEHIVICKRLDTYAKEAKDRFAEKTKKIK